MTTDPKPKISTEQLVALGFSDKIEEEPRRIVASVGGREKSGKTNLALTAPDPIWFFNIDIGTEGVVGKFQRSGKKVYTYDVRVPKGAKQDVYQAMWKDVRSRLEAVYRHDVGTLVMDTATEGFELARLAHFGKLTQIMPHHYTEVNSEWREVLRMAYDSNMNTILIHKQKPKYVNNVRTAEYETSGFGEIAYMVQANIVTYRENGRDGAPPTFSLLIEDCRKNPDLCGQILRGPMVNFEFLLGLVHG
jgi:hypothetical protein